jgi:hypothetical protein
MSTPSIIAIQTIAGTVESIYCQYDGYISNNGKILLNHYDRAKTEQLMELGDISSLGSEIGEKHDFDDIETDWCRAYGRDRGETDTECNQFDTFDEFVEYANDMAEYIYLLMVDNHWKVFDKSKREFVLIGEYKNVS